MALGEFEQAVEILSRQTRVQGLLNATCRELVRLLSAEACLISRVIGDLLIGLDQHVREPRPPLELAHEYLISDYPLTQEVVERGATRDVSLLDEQPEPNEAELLEQLGFDSLLMLCLPSGGACWGLIEVYRNGDRFDEEAGTLAEQVAVVAGRRLEDLI